MLRLGDFFIELSNWFQIRGNLWKGRLAVKLVLGLRVYMLSFCRVEYLA